MGGCQSKLSNIGDLIPIESDIMEFLIVLNAKDYESMCPLTPSYSTQVRRNEDDLPGILHLMNIININDTIESNSRPKYVTQDIVIPRALYIKLPKENIYIKSEKWEYEYLKSQIHEIIHIFGILGAKSIKYEIINSDRNNFNVGAGLNVGELPVGGDLQITSRRGTSTELSGELEFPIPRNIIPSIELIHQSSNIFYLPKKYDWMNICRRRIERQVTSDDFVYKFNSDMCFSTKLTGKLDKLGISFNFESTSVNNLHMKFNVEYYPVNVDIPEVTKDSENDVVENDVVDKKE
jgi:hypothetical protein